MIDPTPKPVRLFGVMVSRALFCVAMATRSALLAFASGCFAFHEAREADASVVPEGDASVEPRDASVEPRDASVEPRDASVEPRDASVEPEGDAGHVECDDGDPCTVGRAVGGLCRFEPAPDGTPCDDGDSCTGADRCEAGVCRGDADEGELLASVTPRFRNGGTGVGAERFVFFRNSGDSSELFLVRAAAERFEVLDEVDLPTVVSTVESLGDDLAVYTTPTDGGLLDLTGDRFTLRGTYSVGGRTREVAVTRDRLWICVAPDWLTTVLYEYALPDLDSPTRIVSGESHGCGSVVSSSHGDHALLADTARNVFRLEASPDGPATAHPLGFVAEALHVGHGYVVATTADEVVLRREVDGFVVGRLSGVFGSARYTSRGLEVYGAPTAHPDENGLSVFAVDGAGGARRTLMGAARGRAAAGRGPLGQSRRRSPDGGPPVRPGGDRAPSP